MTVNINAFIHQLPPILLFEKNLVIHFKKEFFKIFC